MKYQFESKTIATCDECPLSYVDWESEDHADMCSFTGKQVWVGDKPDDCPLTEAGE